MKYKKWEGKSEVWGLWLSLEWELRNEVRQIFLKFLKEIYPGFELGFLLVSILDLSNGIFSNYFFSLQIRFLVVLQNLVVYPVGIPQGVSSVFFFLILFECFFFNFFFPEDFSKSCLEIFLNELFSGFLKEVLLQFLHIFYLAFLQKSIISRGIIFSMRLFWNFLTNFLLGSL